MDSNEITEEKVLDTSTEMEVSNVKVEDKNEKQLNKVSSEQSVIKNKNKSENVVTSVETNETDNNTVESQNTDTVKIDTSKIDSKIIDVENKIDNDKIEKTSKIVKDEDSLSVEKSSSSTSPDAKEGRRKRKSTFTPPMRDPPGEQNGSTVSKRKKVESKSDKYCWRCHKESVDAQCSACPRSWHRRCMGGAPPLSVINWICGECAGILQAENAETRSEAMAQLTVDQLCMMLKHVVERMRDQHGSQPFWKAVDLNEVPNYLDYVVKPMDLGLLETNVRTKLYGSTDAFMADARWIQHNCIVFNTYTSKLTNTAKQMLKVARQEVSEIEACPDCFAHGRNLPRPLPSWFIEPCRRPHPIVWAKLKGFPFWPAKAMPRLNAQGLVDVRFFGEHDRAWVSPKDMYLYSQEPPVPLPKKKKIEMEQCLKEVDDHSKKLVAVFGEFRYAESKVQYDPHDPLQIKLLLPEYDSIKNSRTDISKAEVQKEIPKPVNNKVMSPKIEKKPPSAVVSNDVANTNGVAESPVEKRKLLRKKKVVDAPQQSVNKSQVENDVPVVTKSNKSKNLPVVPPVVNNNASVNNNANEVVKGRTSVSPKTAAIVEPSNGSKKSVTPVKKLKVTRLKNVKPTKEVDNGETKKAVATPKGANLKANTVVHVMPDLNNLQNDSDVVKASPVGQKQKSILINSNLKKVTNAVATKTISKSPQLNNKVANKTINKVVSKEATKVPVNNIQKNKNDSLINKPMTAIPLSTKKDQTKAMYLAMNSNTSESAKHFNDKDAKLNSALTIIKQEPKDDLQPKLTIARKPSKARKSFPNKPPSFPQIMTPAATYPLSKSTAGPSDAMVYIPPQSSELRPTVYELPPPEAGPITAQIHHNSKELANRMAQLIADTIKDAAESNSSNTVNQHEATIHYMKLKMEKLKWEHQQQVTELQHNHDLVLREMKTSMEVERYRALQDARREAEIEKMRCIEETKRKQWCAVCGREAKFYCCWNTAYCNYPCQQQHWTTHATMCGQKTQPQSQPQPQQQKEAVMTPQPLLAGSAKAQQQNGSNYNNVQT